MTTNTVKHTPMLPCPFCGSDVYPKVGPYQFPPDHEGGAWTWGYSVVCDASGFEGSEKGCGSSSAWGEEPEDAIAAWNRRAPAPQEKGSTDKQAAGASRPTNSSSAAHSPAERAGEAPSSSQASPATLSDMPISTTPSFAGRVTGDMPDIPDFLRRTEPKAREWEGA